MVTAAVAAAFQVTAAAAVASTAEVAAAVTAAVTVASTTSHWALQLLSLSEWPPLSQLLSNIY